MAEPLSIITGIASLLGASVKAGTQLQTLANGISIVNVKIIGFLSDIEGFSLVLKVLQETLDRDQVRTSLQETGYIGNHWSSLAKSIEDCSETISQLQETLQKVNKSVGFLDSTRKYFRLQAATEEILVYQSQIRSYKDALQLSLQTVILWNQVTHQKSAYEIFPNLNDIQSEIRRVAFSINDQIRALQNSVEITASRGEVNRLTNLRSCVRSAATIVASASTIIGVETADLDSNFGDCFEFEPSETMLRWMSSSAISGVEEEPTHGQVGDRGLYPPEAPGYNSDSDGDLEAELIQIHINRGKEELTINKFASAERLFRKCLSRIASGGDLSHSQNALRAKILDFLIETCQNQDKYAEVESLLREKLDLWSRNPPEKDILVAQDMFQLSGILIEQRDYQQALLYARQALRTYRKSGADGLSGVGFILFRLETICYLDGDFDEEQAYRLMYLKHCEQTGETPVPPNKPSVVPDLKIPRKAVAPNQTIADVDAELAKGQQPARSSQSDTINLIKQKSDEAEDESEKKEYSISTALQSTPEVVSLYSMEGPSTAINSGEPSKPPKSDRLTMRLPFLFKKRNLGDSGDIIVTVAGIESVIPKEKPYQGLADMQRKLVFVGDCGSGKTCLIVVFSKGVYPETKMPTVYDFYIADAEIDSKHVELLLCDTAGLEDYDRLRPFTYPFAHCILIGFSIDNPDSLDNVEEKWISEILYFCTKLPIILVGMKSDLRYDPKTIEELKKIDQKPVTREEGEAVRRRIGAVKYLECSAITGEGVREVFEHATRAAIKARSNPMKNRKW